MALVTDFPVTKISEDSEEANYQNYLAWQQAQAQRRRESGTQFSMFQMKAARRMCMQVAYKEQSDEKSQELQDTVQRRLSRACDCADCDAEVKARRNSDASNQPSSPTSSVRSSTSSSMATLSSPPATLIKPSTKSSSKNSLIVNPPPRSRQHKRRAQGGQTT